MSAAPRASVVVAGTGTEVGKTYVSVLVAAGLRADGWVVSARKPAQSGEPGEVGDADLLAGATGEDPEVVCPPHRRYDVPMAPPMAAEATGRPSPTIADLASEVTASWPAVAVDLGLVELAGGVASPAADDGDGAELAAAVSPNAVVLVADAGLGTINAVRLSLARLAAALPDVPAVVLLNRFDGDDELHRRNRDWLAARDGLDVVTDAHELADRLAGLVPRHCASCGRLAADCDGSCARPLDPDRYCDRCGRRAVVVVTPTGHTARCKLHGPLTT